MFIKRSSPQQTDIVTGSSASVCSVCNKPFVHDDKSSSVCSACQKHTESENKNKKS